MIYKNLSNTTKTFYGVTFKPNEEHEVPGYINHPKFLRLESSSCLITENSTSESDKSELSSKKVVSSKTTTIKKGVNSNGADIDK